MRRGGIATCLALVVATQPVFADSGSQMPAILRTPARAHWLTDPYLPRRVSPVDFANSGRLHDLIRAGNIYLSLSDALALAIENNLDIELERFTIPIAATETLRARGGGTLRGVLYTLADTPAGIGGPASPLITAAASGTPGTSVASNASELAVLGEAQTNLSILGSTPLSTGPAPPAYDALLSAQYNWLHQSVPETSLQNSGVPVLRGDLQNGNLGYQQGFGSGAQVNVGFENAAQALNSTRNNIFPYTASNLSLTVTQPLLRGFGFDVNRRFIRIAKNEEKITDLLFEQQVMETVYGVVRLYTDLVALNEDVKVKRETLAFAQKFLDDAKAGVDEGTLAPVELTRARAQLSASQQDLINSSGVTDEQEAILKNVLTRRGNEDMEVRSAHIIPTDPLTVPAADGIPPIDDLLKTAYTRRPDLAQARIQVENSEISLKGSNNNLRPQLDLVGTAQNNALAGTPYAPAGAGYPAFAGGYGTVLDQLLTRKNPTYGVGLNLTLPLRNRVAQADALRDELQVRQSQVRERQLRNQVQLEVEDALIAVRRARASYEAAQQTRQLQEQSLEVEQLKFAEGASTSFFVLQYESYAAQARSTEVAAKSSYVKARAALERAIGSILADHGVALDSARSGRVNH